MGLKLFFQYSKLGSLKRIPTILTIAVLLITFISLIVVDQLRSESVRTEVSKSCTGSPTSILTHNVVSSEFSFDNDEQSAAQVQLDAGPGGHPRNVSYTYQANVTDPTHNVNILPRH
jgi:hypothetical protein